ncbi:hypothetical protein JTB14_023224 [Gonioctena quinquepunctata]|nr:hypothetical protein JTB14_023224 [Gonioctena quinquepunctata]
MDGRRILTKQNAGLNRRMDSNYIWPDNFGTGARIQSETDIRTQKVHRNRMGREEIEIADIFCPPSQLERIAPVSQKENSMDRIDAISNGSRHSNVETQRKLLALETEKARQKIEMRQKELANEMALLELERDVREAELCDIEENGSVRSTYDIEEANVRIVNPCENPLSSPVSEWVSQTQKNLPNSCRQHIYETNSNFPEEKSDVCRYSTVTQEPRRYHQSSFLQNQIGTHLWRDKQ